MDEKEQKIIESITSHKPESKLFKLKDSFFTARYKIEDGDKLTKEEQNKIITSYIQKNIRIRMK
jgi:hypothetical protein